MSARTDPLATTWQEQVLAALASEPLSDLQLRDAEQRIVKRADLCADPEARIVARLLVLLADAVELADELPLSSRPRLPLQRAVLALRDAARRAVRCLEETR